MMQPKKTASLLILTVTLCFCFALGHTVEAQETQTIIILEGKEVAGKRVFLGEVSETG